MGIVWRKSINLIVSHSKPNFGKYFWNSREKSIFWCHSVTNNCLQSSLSTSLESESKIDTLNLKLVFFHSLWRQEQRDRALRSSIWSSICLIMGLKSLNHSFGWDLHISGGVVPAVECLECVHSFEWRVDKRIRDSPNHCYKYTLFNTFWNHLKSSSVWKRFEITFILNK